jgi:hypothetical protein
MGNEIIYIPNTKLLILEKYEEFFKANFLGNTIEIKEAEKLGKTFNIEVNQLLKDKDSAKKKLEEIFQTIPYLNPLTNSLEYLIKAEIPFTLGKREEDKTQYLGLSYENPIKIDIGSKIPCQFYCINDKLQEKWIKYSFFFPTFESSSNHSPTSDETSQQLTSKIHHQQAFSYLL